VGIAWAVAFWLWFRDRPEQVATVNAAELDLIRAGRDTSRVTHRAIPWRRLLRSRSVWGLCFMYAGVGVGANFYVTLLPNYLKHERHLADDDIKLLSGLPFACGMVACALGGVLSDVVIRRSGSRRWGRRVSALALLGAAAAWLALNQVEHVWALGLVLCLIFFFNDLNMGPAWAACADVGESHAGVVGGAMNMLGSWSGACGNLVAGVLFKTGDPEWVFGLYAACYVLAALCWLAVDVNRPLTQDEA
jgi:nitrate/nitrite transporter NarK